MAPLRPLLLLLLSGRSPCGGGGGRPPAQRRQVRWHVDAGAAGEGVAAWATHVAGLGAITGLYGCCGRFSIAANGTWRDNWPEEKYPLSDWDFVHPLGLTMFVPAPPPPSHPSTHPPRPTVRRRPCGADRVALCTGTSPSRWSRPR